MINLESLILVTTLITIFSEEEIDDLVIWRDEVEGSIKSLIADVEEIIELKSSISIAKTALPV